MSKLGDQLQEAVGQFREALSLGHIAHFEPSLHPRDRVGRFRDILGRLGVGEKAKLPDGTSVTRRDDSRFDIHKPGGRSVRGILSAHQAASTALGSSHLSRTVPNLKVNKPTAKLAEALHELQEAHGRGDGPGYKAAQEKLLYAEAHLLTERAEIAYGWNEALHPRSPSGEFVAVLRAIKGAYKGEINIGDLSGRGVISVKHHHGVYEIHHRGKLVGHHLSPIHAAEHVGRLHAKKRHPPEPKVAEWLKPDFLGAV